MNKDEFACLLEFNGLLELNSIYQIVGCKKYVGEYVERKKLAET